MDEIPVACAERAFPEFAEHRLLPMIWRLRRPNNRRSLPVPGVHGQQSAGRSSASWCCLLPNLWCNHFLALRTAVTGSPKIDDIDTNGNLLALATLFSTSATVGLIALLIVVRRYPVRDYLPLYRPPPRSVLTARGPRFSARRYRPQLVSAGQTACAPVHGQYLPFVLAARSGWRRWFSRPWG